MSQENVDRHRRLLELHRGFPGTLDERREAELIEVCDPEIEIRSSFAAVGGAVYRGHDGVRAWLQELQETWGGEFRIEADEFFDLGDQTLALGDLLGRGTHSGIEVTMQAIGVARWRDGRCLSHRGYMHREDALRDLGITEADLAALDPSRPG